MSYVKYPNFLGGNTLGPRSWRGWLPAAPTPAPMGQAPRPGHRSSARLPSVEHKSAPKHPRRRKCALNRGSESRFDRNVRYVFHFWRQKYVIIRVHKLRYVKIHDIILLFCMKFMMKKLGQLFQINKPIHNTAQLILSNPRDAVRDQSRSPNIVPFHMLGILS